MPDIEDAIEDQELADNPTPVTRPLGVPDPSLAQTLQNDASKPKSWGDKYKGTAFKFVRDVAVNFVVNAGLAAFFGYGVANSPLGPKIDKWVENRSQGNEFKKFFWNFMTKTQLLLCGGHVLQPTLKWMRDNKNSIEAKYGDMLDRFEMALGKGNETTQQNIEDYKRVTELQEAGKKHRKDSSIPLPELTERDKALAEKYNLNDQLQFNENRLTVGAVVKARLTSVLFTTCLSIGLVFSRKQPYKALKYEETYEGPAGEWLGKNVIAKTPGLSTIIGKPNKLGEVCFTEIFYTLIGNVGYGISERLHDKKQASAAALPEKKWSEDKKPQIDYRTQVMQEDKSAAMAASH